MESKVKELKELVGFGLSVGVAVDKSLADDGKVTVSDIPKFGAPVLRAPEAIMGADKALDELRALDDAGRAELHQYAKDEFDVRDDLVEQVVEEAIVAGVAVARIVALLTKPKAPEASAAPA